MKIEKLYTYPVKALRAVELDSVQVTKHGFPHDRRFMVLQVLKEDDGSIKYKNIHVAHFPESVRFFPSLDLEGERVKVTYKPANGGEEKHVDFPLYPETDDLDAVEVDMHKSPTKAYKMPQKYNDWFSSCYGFEVILAHLGRNYRAVLMSTSHNKQTPQPSNNSAGSWLSTITSTATSYLTGSNKENATPADLNILTFNDCAPYLIASARSMDDLHHRLGDSPNTKMDILKFRPNIILSGASEPWEEDYWGELTITSPSSPQTKISCIHNCGRCKSINIDYDTGAPSTGPEGNMLKQMQRDRRVDPGTKWSPIFGRYSFLGEGCEGNVVRVGDEVVVSERLGERTRFGEFLSFASFVCIWGLATT
ncbi:hypothetical protein M409DRAFT_62004 [Zasmidium cellare ATCC 36951]|uniref:MOSC domain-containing protein n=1 Tax=Zasmidium cellare ATCC 36951 TaxID=1080233 RepID=A0A6A6D5N7_ZASCE|nr:uncharacterized protein M409DRAFT_62004 [Zasmidium cellare ATCC 36951]KAF2173728.1 hypothetical protein M409DRAFT_62004 [Zasmidium cellare ATCC 36951]